MMRNLRFSACRSWTRIKIRDWNEPFWLYRVREVWVRMDSLQACWASGSKQANSSAACTAEPWKLRIHVVWKKCCLWSFFPLCRGLERAPSSLGFQNGVGIFFADCETLGSLGSWDVWCDLIRNEVLLVLLLMEQLSFAFQ